MQISGRNKLQGSVVNTVKGTVTAEVEVDIGNGNKIAGVISKKALEDLQIKNGDKITALIKATSVMFIKD